MSQRLYTPFEQAEHLRARWQARAEKAEAEAKALREALEEVLDNDCYHPENLPEGDERCRRARAALAGVKT